MLMTTLPAQFILFSQQSSHSLAFVNCFNVIHATFVTPLFLQVYGVLTAIGKFFILLLFTGILICKLANFLSIVCLVII